MGEYRCQRPAVVKVSHDQTNLATWITDSRIRRLSRGKRSRNSKSQHLLIREPVHKVSVEHGRVRIQSQHNILLKLTPPFDLQRPCLAQRHCFRQCSWLQRRSYSCLNIDRVDVGEERLDRREIGIRSDSIDRYEVGLYADGQQWIDTYGHLREHRPTR